MIRAIAITAAALAIVSFALGGAWILRPPACPTYTMTDLLHMADPVPECK
jgi:hypothetical protein